MSRSKTEVNVFGIRNCDTMKKTFAWLEGQGIPYTFVDYKKAGVVESHLPQWVAAVGWEPLVNRKGLTWKKLPEADRADVDQAKACALMIANPTLIKRPVMVVRDQVLVGFDPEAFAQRLK